MMNKRKKFGKRFEKAEIAFTGKENKFLLLLSVNEFRVLKT